MNKEIIENDKLKSILPDIRKEFDILQSNSFVEYEDKLTKATGKAIDALQSIISDGTLAMDPEQLVRAVDVLAKAKTGIVDSKRRLLETLIKGEVMMKALEPPKQSGGNVLDEYIARQKNISMESNVNSIFSDIEKAEDK